MAPIVSISGLWWRYSPEAEWTLKGVNLNIQQGERVAIVGPTGAGKTTLLSFMQALLPHSFPSGEMRGTVLVDGLDVSKVRASKLVGKVGMVFEDAEAQFVLPNVEDDLLFTLESLGLQPDAIRQRIEDITREFNLEKLINRTVGELSGGEKQRLAIAELIAVRPRLLLLDEPTSELDPLSKKEVLSMMERACSESDMTVVIVEQDLQDIASMVDRFILLDHGQVKLDLETRKFLLNASDLLDSGVYPPEVCLVFEPFVRTGRIKKLPLSVEEAAEILGLG